MRCASIWNWDRVTHVLHVLYMLKSTTLISQDKCSCLCAKDVLEVNMMQLSLIAKSSMYMYTRPLRSTHNVNSSAGMTSHQMNVRPTTERTLPSVPTQFFFYLWEEVDFLSALYSNEFHWMSWWLLILGLLVTFQEINHSSSVFSFLRHYLLKHNYILPFIFILFVKMWLDPPVRLPPLIDWLPSIIMILASLFSLGIW